MTRNIRFGLGLLVVVAAGCDPGEPPGETMVCDPQTGICKRGEECFLADGITPTCCDSNCAGGDGDTGLGGDGGDGSTGPTEACLNCVA